jgi:hypothetical protein
MLIALIIWETAKQKNTNIMKDLTKQTGEMAQTLTRTIEQK